MISKGQVLLFLSNILGTYCAVKSSVLYTAVPGSTNTDSISRNIECAFMMMDRSLVAIRTNVLTGICEGLTWDWGTSPQYDGGFSYFVKKTTKEIYDPPLLLGTPYQWLIPGWFSVGGRFDIYMTPTAESNTYYIRILDTTPTSYSVYDSFPEVIMVDIEVKKPLGFVYFKTYAGGWWNRGMHQPFPFTEGVQHKVTIIPDADTITIMFDEEQVISYNHPTNPENAKQLQFTFAAGDNVMVNSIIFVGI